MVTVQLVEAKWLEDHFIHISQHVMQPQGIGFKQPTELQLAICRLSTGKPFVGIQAIGHRIADIFVLRLLHFHATACRKLPLHFGGQAHKAQRPIFLGQLGCCVLAQPAVVGIGRTHGLQPADSHHRQTPHVAGLGARWLHQCLVLQVGHLILGQQVVT